MISTGFARPLFFDVANSLLIFPFHLAKHIKRSLSYPSAGQFKFLFNPGILFPFFQKAGSFYAAWRINPIISFFKPFSSNRSSMFDIENYILFPYCNAI